MSLDKIWEMRKPKIVMEEKLLDKFNKIESRHWWWEGRRQLVKQLLRDKEIKLLRVLDIGCGTGETMSFIKALVKEVEVYGIDTSKIAVSYSKSRGHKKVYLAGAGKLPFAANFFDAVVMLDVLEHIQDAKQALAEAKRVLKKRGVMIVSCPAMQILWSDHDANQGHVKRYARKDLRKLAKDAGLKVEWIGYFNFFLSPIIAAVRWLSRVPNFSHLASYESGANYEVANKGLVNEILKKVFVNEVKLAQKISYPWGVSVAIKLRKA